MTPFWLSDPIKHLSLDFFDTEESVFQYSELSCQLKLCINCFKLFVYKLFYIRIKNLGIKYTKLSLVRLPCVI